jgi:hypothetical protein
VAKREDGGQIARAGRKALLGAKVLEDGKKAAVPSNGKKSSQRIPRQKALL